MKRFIYSFAAGTGAMSFFFGAVMEFIADEPAFTGMTGASLVLGALAGAILWWRDKPARGPAETPASDAA